MKFIKWSKKVWLLYEQIAEANGFQISEYGLFGEKWI